MAYVNIPANLQDMFYALDDRIRKLETGPSSAQSSADIAYSTASTAVQTSADTIVNASNQLTAINGNGVTVYSGASSTTGARVVLNSAGIAGFNSSGTATFAINSATGDVSMTGTVYSTNGSIGGFVLGPYSIASTSGSVQILSDSTGYIYTGGRVAANNANIGGYTGTVPSYGMGVYGDINTSGALLIGGNITGSSQAIFASMTSAAPSSSYWNVMITSTGRLTRSTTNNSSRKTKDNITYLTTDTYLDTINKLQPASFTYKPNLVENPDAIQYGLIAEDVEPIDKNLVGYDENGEVNSVVYERIPIYLIKAIQEITHRLTALEAK